MMYDVRTRDSVEDKSGIEMIVFLHFFFDISGKYTTIVHIGGCKNTSDLEYIICRK